MRVEGREIMMHHYSPSPRWLAVPGIGFPQNISVGPNGLDPEDFRDWSFTARWKTQKTDGRLPLLQIFSEIRFEGVKV
jgi:hypothetical protein